MVKQIYRMGEIMKKKDENKNKKVPVLNYFASVCFYICAIMNFVNKDNSMAVVYLCLGSTFLCLGSTYLNKDKDSNKK